MKPNKEILASHVWRQDHKGFTHHYPGFIDPVVNKKAEVVRLYFLPDANCLLSVMDAIDRLPQTGAKGIYLKHQFKNKLIEHKQFRKQGPGSAGDPRMEVDGAGR